MARSLQPVVRLTVVPGVAIQVHVSNHLQAQLKKVPGINWNPSKRSWELPPGRRSLQLLVDEFGAEVVVGVLADYNEQQVEIERQQSEIARLEEEVERLQADNEDWERHVAEWKQQFEILEQDRDTLYEQLEECKETHHEQTLALADARQRLEELEGEAAAARRAAVPSGTTTSTGSAEPATSATAKNAHPEVERLLTVDEQVRTNAAHFRVLQQELADGKAKLQRWEAHLGAELAVFDRATAAMESVVSERELNRTLSLRHTGKSLGPDREREYDSRIAVAMDSLSEARATVSDVLVLGEHLAHVARLAAPLQSAFEAVEREERERAAQLALKRRREQLDRAAEQRARAQARQEAEDAARLRRRQEAESRAALLRQNPPERKPKVEVVLPEAERGWHCPVCGRHLGTPAAKRLPALFVGLRPATEEHA